MKKSFEVTVRGQYQALGEHSGIPTLKGYEETFILPSQEAALSNICKHLLSPRLKKSHSDFIRYRTHELVGMRLVGYSPNKDVLQMSFDEMNLLELHDFCILRQIMIDPYKHADKDIFALRQMVQKAYTEKRQAQKDLETSKQGAQMKEADDLRRLNDLDPTALDPVININEQKLSHAANQKTVDAAPKADKTPDENISNDPLPPFVEDANEPILE